MSRDLDLHNIVLHTIGNRFVEDFFVGISLEGNAAAFGISKNFLIPGGHFFPIPLIEGLEIKALGPKMKPRFRRGGREHDEEPAVVVICAPAQAFHGDHGSVGGIVKAAELLSLLLSAGMFLKYRKRYGY